MTSNVTIYPHVEDGPGVTQFPSVTEYISTTAGANGPPDLALVSGGILLLMTGGSLLLV